MGPVAFPRRRTRFGLGALARGCYYDAMAVRHVLQLGDPLLRAVSKPVPPDDAAAILQDLEETLAEFRRGHGFGRAISAVQIGQAVQMCIRDRSRAAQSGMDRTTRTPFATPVAKFTWSASGCASFSVWARLS